MKFIASEINQRYLNDMVKAKYNEINGTRTAVKVCGLRCSAKSRKVMAELYPEIKNVKVFCKEIYGEYVKMIDPNAFEIDIDVDAVNELFTKRAA